MENMSRESLSMDRSVLAMALVGYEIEKTKIEEKIREIRAQIGVSAVSRLVREFSGEMNVSGGAQPKQRKFSAAARKRMAAAQRKRWAEQRKQKSAA
jgi:hypothetical protein